PIRSSTASTSVPGFVCAARVTCACQPCSRSRCRGSVSSPWYTCSVSRPVKASCTSCRNSGSAPRVAGVPCCSTPPRSAERCSCAGAREHGAASVCGKPIGSPSCERLPLRFSQGMLLGKRTDQVSRCALHRCRRRRRALGQNRHGRARADLASVSLGAMTRRWFLLLLCYLLAPASLLCAEQTTRAPILLVAAPELEDPNFSQSVVLVLFPAHGGPVGVILNKPSELTVKEAFPEDKLLRARADKVFFGGPVRMDVLSYLVRSAKPPKEGYKVLDNVYLTQDAS